MPRRRSDRITITKLQPPPDYRHAKKQHGHQLQSTPVDEYYSAILRAPSDEKLVADNVAWEKLSDSEEGEGQAKQNNTKSSNSKNMYMYRKIIDVDDLPRRPKLIQENDINELQKSIQVAFARSSTSRATSPTTQASDDGLNFDEIIKDLTNDENDDDDVRYEYDNTGSDTIQQQQQQQQQEEEEEEEETAATTKDYFGDNDDTKDIDDSSTAGLSESLKMAEPRTIDMGTAEAESKQGEIQDGQADDTPMSLFSPCTACFCSSSDVTLEALQNLKEQYGVHLRLEDLKDHFVEDMAMDQLVMEMKDLQNDIREINMSQLLQHLGLPPAALEEPQSSESVVPNQKLLLPRASIIEEGSTSSSSSPQPEPEPEPRLDPQTEPEPKAHGQSLYTTCITGADHSVFETVFSEEEGLEIPYLSCPDDSNLEDLKSANNKTSKSSLFGGLFTLSSSSKAKDSTTSPIGRSKNMKVFRIQLSDGTMATVSQDKAAELRQCNWI